MVAVPNPRINLRENHSMAAPELERRESRRRTTTLYDHSSSKAHRDERDRKPDAEDALRRQHAVERDDLRTTNHAEAQRLRMKHNAERAAHRDGPRPADLDKRHADEMKTLLKSHSTKSDALDEVHRAQRDRLRHKG